MNTYNAWPFLHTLTLSRPFATRLLFEAQKSPDTEVCGFVSARDGRAWGLYPIDNVAADPARRFDMDAQQQITAMKTMRERGEAMLAVYHSHPSTPPEPSIHDIQGLGYPEALLLIISLNIKGVLEMRAWQRNDGAMREIPLAAAD